MVPPTRPVKMRVSPFTASAEALSSTNNGAVQLPRDMMPGKVHHQADFDAGQIVSVEMPVVDADAGPGLAAAFGRRMIAEREHAGAEHRAAARQRHFAFQVPVFESTYTPASSFLTQIVTGQWRRQQQRQAQCTIIDTRPHG